MSPRDTRPADPMLLTIGWGVLWAIALGLWVLAPAVVETHRIRPAGAAQWSLVILAIGTALAAIGGVLGFVGGFALAVGEKVAAGAFRDRRLAYGLAMPVVVTAGYSLQAILIHWSSFRSFRGLDLSVPDVLVLLTACLAGGLAAGLLYRTLLRVRGDRASSALAGCVALAAVAGGAALPARSPQMAKAPVIHALRRAETTHGATPLLLIGLDGATWRVLDPAISNGSAPTLRRLVECGVHGTVDALWPPHWSGAAWAAIVTGLPREQTGVYEDLAARAPGLPPFQVPIESRLMLNPLYVMRAAYRAGGLLHFTPPPRPILRGTPIWQLLHRSGVETAVVRWRFTYPPEGQAGIVVSDFVGRDQWDGMGVRRPDPRTAVAPATLAGRLIAPFEKEPPVDPSLFSRLLPGPRPAKPADALGDPIEELELASDIDDRTFEVSETILRLKPQLGFLAIYIGGLDSVEHAFWQYRFPGDFPDDPPAPADVERLGPVIDRYVRYLDERLARLLALYRTGANVVIVSDHGHGPTTTSSKWRGWHTRDGVFVAAGPAVPSRAGRMEVSYFDVVPTVAALGGFETPSGLTGRSLVGPAGNPLASRRDHSVSARTSVSAYGCP